MFIYRNPHQEPGVFRHVLYGTQQLITGHWLNLLFLRHIYLRSSRHSVIVQLEGKDTALGVFHFHPHVLALDFANSGDLLVVSRQPGAEQCAAAWG